MKAKSVLRALSKSGIIDISTGKQINKIVKSIETGVISSRKEYLFSFKENPYLTPSAVIVNLADNIVYLYEI